MRGVTLLELLLVLCLAGLLALLGVLPATRLRDRLLVERAAAEILGAHERARGAALVSGGLVQLEITPALLRVVQVSGTDTVPVWEAPGPTRLGVGLVASHQAITVGPHGLFIGLANGRLDLSRGGAHRGIVVSRPGRLRVDRRP